MTVLTEMFIKKCGPNDPILAVEVILPTNKRYPGITGDNPLETVMTGLFGTRCRLITSETEKGLKGWLFTD
jgi:hypothetical protein